MTVKMTCNGCANAVKKALGNVNGERGFGPNRGPAPHWRNPGTPAVRQGPGQLRAFTMTSPTPRLATQA